jgi:hypothetical protein
MAQAWLCREPGPDGADGVCRACGAFERGASADFLSIAPSGPSQIIKQSTITASDDKDAPVPLNEFFRTAPLMSAHKVVLIEQVHRMNETTFNSILKTLEEPPPHAKLVLTTDSISTIPPTILSRCLGVACELPSRTDVNRLFPRASADDLLLSEGAPGRTAQILEHSDQYRAIVAFARSLKGRPAGAALVASEQFKSICDGLESALDCGARAANAEALESLAVVFARDQEIDPTWTHLTLEAHRRIRGNGGAGLVFDALFSGLLAR